MVPNNSHPPATIVLFGVGSSNKILSGQFLKPTIEDNQVGGSQHNYNTHYPFMFVAVCYVQLQATEFCDSDVDGNTPRRNGEAPTVHNRLCQGQSIWNAWWLQGWAKIRWYCHLFIPQARLYWKFDTQKATANVDFTGRTTAWSGLKPKLKGTSTLSASHVVQQADRPYNLNVVLEGLRNKTLHEEATY